MTPAEHLAALPEAVQAELWDLARTAIGMDDDEKLTAVQLISTVAEEFLTKGRHIDRPTVALLSSAGQVVVMADREANPRETEVV